MALSGEDFLLEALYEKQLLHIGDTINSPVQHVQHYVDRVEERNANEKDVHPVFVELMKLTQEEAPEGYRFPTHQWVETSRWIKYEESVEEGGLRWSKPHLTLLTMPAMLQLRNCFRKGVVLLDIQADDFLELTNQVLCNQWPQHQNFSDEIREILKRVLLSEKHHLVGSRFRDHLSKNNSVQVEPERNSKLRRTKSSGSLLQQNGLVKNERSQDELELVEHSPAKSKNVSGFKNALLRKMPKVVEAMNIFLGQLEFIEAPLAAFVRLKSPALFLDIPEVPIPTRFVFILFAPKSDHSTSEIEAIGRALGTLMVDPVFATVAYRSEHSSDLCEGIDEFLGQSLIIPAGRVPIEHRMEPNQVLVNRTPGMISKRKPSALIKPATEQKAAMPAELKRTGWLFGGLVQDIRRKARWYWSDYRDVFRADAFLQVLAGTLFLFFANITKVITFAGVMESLLDRKMATFENLLSGGICGILFALFGGQPLVALSAAGPTLLFEAIIYDYCEDHNWPYFETRFWIGAWSGAIILLLVAVDASAVVALITKFTEDAFACFISIVYIIQAVQELNHIQKEAPLTPSPEKTIYSACECYHNYTTNASIKHYFHDHPEAEEEGHHPCDTLFLPDVFLFSEELFFGTFIIAYGLKLFRHSGLFKNIVRQTIADFNVLIAIVVMTGVNIAYGFRVPNLHVPSKFEPTVPRPWIIPPLPIQPWWLVLAAAIPALLLTILVVLDQYFTSVIINRKDNKLQKGYGYHLDLLVLAVLMVICALLGIPFFIAGPVITMMHVDSLKKTTECAAPGEKPQFLGIREQRVSSLIAGILIGIAVLLTSVIRLIPLPVLLGIFLYMGIVSLQNLEFIHRLMLLVTPVKYQHDYRYLQLVPLRRVHLFTLVQLGSILLLFAVQYSKPIAMLFPLMLIVILFIRKGIEKIFTEQELRALDDSLPGLCDVFRAKSSQPSTDRKSCCSCFGWLKRKRVVAPSIPSHTWIIETRHGTFHV